MLFLLLLFSNVLWLLVLKGNNVGDTINLHDEMILSSSRGNSASLNMSSSCQIRKRSFVNFTSKDTAAKEIIVFTCTISFTNDKCF